MLHEILLALSGHPSPLFSEETLDDNSAEAFPLSPSEKALLQSIGQLSELHRKLRKEIDQIARSHASIVCRAFATSIQQTHLPRFQNKIIEVERKILTKDAHLVGAYDIVPLAGIVSEFDGWQRRMAWYWDMICFVQPQTTAESTHSCSGAALIDRLRSEQHTGFPDVETAAMELSKVTETAWLRQAASWVLYGKLPKFGASDFFVQLQNDETGAKEDHFIKDRDLLPKFVTPSTASSILFIGKSLHQVRTYGKRSRDTSCKAVSEGELASLHLQHLSSLALPIVSTHLSRAISAIRLSLSQNVLKHLLPMEMTLELLCCFKDFFLLGRGEFAITFINEAENRLQARQHSMGKLLQQDPVKALQGLSIKDAEFQQTLASTWKRLAAVRDDVDDDLLEFARGHFRLSSPADHNSRPSTSDSTRAMMVEVSTISFNDLLFPSAVSLGFEITPPLDLFVSPREVETYSSLNAYLLAIRRAQLRLSSLWRRTATRRDQTGPGSRSGQPTSGETRSRTQERNIAMRKVWATCSAAVFLVSEKSAYLESEVINSSWSRFEQWVRTPVSSAEAENVEMKGSTQSTPDAIQRDPETLASGHRTFLAALVYAVLLTDVPYTRDLRSLLGNIDNLISFFNSLSDIQQKLDLEYDAGDATGYTIGEERRIALELDRARKKVDSDLKSVVNRLRQVDQERIGSARYLDLATNESGFEPFKTGGVDRLLMKLEFGRVSEGGFDIV